MEKEKRTKGKERDREMLSTVKCSQSEMGCGELAGGVPRMAEREGRLETGIEDGGIDALWGDQG